MKFATKFEIQKGLKYEICIKFNGNLKFAAEIWNIDVILLSDRPLAPATVPIPKTCHREV